MKRRVLLSYPYPWSLTLGNLMAVSPAVADRPQHCLRLAAPPHPTVVPISYGAALFRLGHPSVPNHFLVSDLLG